MLQRIQTLFLLVAAAFVAAFMVLGDAWRTGLAGTYPWVGPLALLLGGIVILASLVAVFLYKDRSAQRKVVSVAQWTDLALVLLLVGAMAALNLGDAPVPAMADAMQAAYITALLPFGAYIFLRLARRGIEKDIALVRSMDRLR